MNIKNNITDEFNAFSKTIQITRLDVFPTILNNKYDQME